MSLDLTLRPVSGEDLAGLADLYQRARAAAVPAMPALAHPPDEVVDWVSGWDLRTREVWVAEADGLVGFVMLQGDWLDSLYVDPVAQRGGIGSALLDVARSLRPGGFELWVFESNQPARAFYRRHGLLELEHTDGSGNEERAPDLRMAWPGEDPVSFLRSRIDDVDRELAQFLARRTMLTAVVQDHKPVGGQTGRDPARERVIAEQMATRAPVLGVDRLTRIVQAIITESLDAAEHLRR